MPWIRTRIVCGPSISGSATEKVFPVPNFTPCEIPSTVTSYACCPAAAQVTVVKGTSVAETTGAPGAPM